MIRLLKRKMAVFTSTKITIAPSRFSKVPLR